MITKPDTYIYEQRGPMGLWQSGQQKFHGEGQLPISNIIDAQFSRLLVARPGQLFKSSPSHAFMWHLQICIYLAIN